MADMDKYADEMLTDEELDNVAGGTWQELQELYSAMAGDRVLSKYLKTSKRDNINLEEIAKVLKEKLGIDFLYGTLDRKNEYTHNGQKIDHHKLVEFCKRYDDITHFLYS